MGNTYTIRLEANDIGQILDGLRCRAESWRGTMQYHETGTTPNDTFVIEECRDADEARKLTACYDRLVGEIEGQLTSQRKGPRTIPSFPPPSTAQLSYLDGFCICIDTCFQVKKIAVTDQLNRPCIFNSERAAQAEIVENLMTRLHEFLDGERDYEDAITIDEFVERVHLKSNEIWVDENGNSLSP